MSVAAEKTHVPEVVTRSPAMQRLALVVERLAQARSAVLIEGESGTGKDLVADWLHLAGPRCAAPMVKVHCPSIPGDLLESELLGHERGAFTDARQAKVGKLELADGGTVYFDQIQELDRALQAKLLRVVEERRFERLGGTRTIEIDVRFVSSASVDLREAVRRGLFRDDLYHRLGVVPLVVPPLRERPEDILPLAQLFLARERARGTTPARSIDAPAAAALRGYPWPGNVRELRAAVERAALYSPGEVLSLPALPPVLVEQPASLWTARPQPPSLKEVEEAYIRRVLEDVHGNQTQAAAILGISRKALWEKRRRYGIP